MSGERARVPLFVALLGERFNVMPPSLRAVHGATGLRQFAGEAEVARGTGCIAWLCARVAGLPADYRGRFRVEIDGAAPGERWSRHFGSTTLRSRVWMEGNRLHERLGPMTFAFALDTKETAVEWRMVRARFLALPVPLRWFDGVRAQAFDCDGRYAFDVSVTLPLVGTLVRYRGWLDVG